MVLGFPSGSAGKESAHNAGDLGSVPGLGRCPGKGKGYPLQYSGLENSMDSPWSCKELDMTEQLSQVYFFKTYKFIYFILLLFLFFTFAFALCFLFFLI